MFITKNASFNTANYGIDYPNFLGKGAPRRSTMVPLSTWYREPVSSHRLSIQPRLSQFAMLSCALILSKHACEVQGVMK